MGKAQAALQSENIPEVKGHSPPSWQPKQLTTIPTTDEVCRTLGVVLRLPFFPFGALQDIARVSCFLIFLLARASFLSASSQQLESNTPRSRGSGEKEG